MKIFRNPHPTSIDIMDPGLGYYVPIMPYGLVISPYNLESKMGPLEEVEDLNSSLRSMLQFEPYMINPNIISEDLEKLIRLNWKIENFYSKFNGREWKVFVNFGINFSEKKKFSMFLNENRIYMRNFKFFEERDVTEIYPMEYLCVLLALHESDTQGASSSSKEEETKYNSEENVN